MGSSPVPQIPWQHWGYVWHLYCLSSVQEGQGLWIWKTDLLVLLGEVSLLLSCWHSELERKRFLISKKVPMCENSSKLLSQKKDQQSFQNCIILWKKELPWAAKSEWKKWLHFRVKTGYRWADKSLQPCLELRICNWILMDTFIYPIAFAEGSEFAGAPEASWEPCKSNGNVKPLV